MKKCLVILVLALALAMACGIALADDNFLVQTGFLPEQQITINKVNLAGEEVPVTFDGNFDPSYLTNWLTQQDLCGTMLELSYTCHDPADEFFGHTVIVRFHFTHGDGTWNYEHLADGTSRYLCDRCLKWVTVPASEVTRAEHYAAGMEWRWDPKATCDNPGESVFACKVCGWVDEEYTAGHVNTIQHDPVLVVVAPTCVQTDIGEAYWKCARCGVYLQFDSSFTDLKVVKTKAQAALNTEDDTGTAYALNTMKGFSDWYAASHASLKNGYWTKAPGAFDPHKWGSPFETIPANCWLNSYSMRICQLCEKTKVTENARSNLGTKYELLKVERDGSCFKVKATFTCANCIALGTAAAERCTDLEITFENGQPQSAAFVGNYSGVALKAKSSTKNTASFPGGAASLSVNEAVAAVGMKNIDLLQKIQMHEYILSPDYLVKIEEGNCTMGTVKYYKCIYCDDEQPEHTQPGLVDPLDTELLTDCEQAPGQFVKSMLKAVVTGAPKGHDWDGYVFKGKSGNMQLWVRTCKVCGETDNWIAETPPPEACATHTPVVASSVKATCDADGYTTYKCKVCGIDLPELTKVEKAKGHSDKSVLVETTKAATCTEKGIGKYYCPDCNTSYTKELPALGHKWAATPYETKEATKTEDGYKKFKCENEGCKEIKTEVVKYVVTAPAKYELKDVKYEDGIVSGKLVHVEDTLEAPELGIRVTFFNENTYITVSAMLKADGSFVAKGAGAVEHVTVAAYATEDVVTADGLEDKWFGSVSIDVK